MSRPIRIPRRRPVEIVTLFPGASAEEVEKQVTIPLESALASMPGLASMHTKTVFGLSDVKLLFNYGVEYKDARQEAINRKSDASLPSGVTPQISPESPTGEIFRYWLRAPKDAAGRNIYTLNDLKALQDWVLEREFRSVPRVVDVTSWGGTVRRYEVQPDPDRMRRYGITLAQLQSALANSNATVGGDYVKQGDVAMTVRSVGLFGGGEDPVRKVLGKTDPAQAARVLRSEEERRLREIRSLVITSVNNQPVRVEDVVEGGRLIGDVVENGRVVFHGERGGERGVVVSHQTRLGQMAHYQVKQGDGYESSFQGDHAATLHQLGQDDPDQVGCIVLLRKGEATLPALKDIEAKVKELNDPSSGRMLPGVEIVPYYNRTRVDQPDDPHGGREPVDGMGLVIVILLIFLGNVRTRGDRGD